MRWPVRLVRLAVIALALFAGGRAHAHDPGAVYVKLRIDGASVTTAIDLYPRDALALIAWPAYVEGRNALAVIFPRQDALARAVEGAIEIRSSGRICPVSAAAPPVSVPEESNLVRVHVVARCDEPVEQLSLRIPLLARLDGQRRGLVAVENGAAIHAAVLSQAEPVAAFDLSPPAAFSHFVPYLVDGMHHVASGIDHLLFLAALLLPAALVRVGSGWKPRERAREVLVEIALVASAFTVAHSVTLAAAGLDLVRVPRRLVESAIAVTVVVAALNNLGNFVRLRPWKLAFGLGLVHGLGFAADLGILGLPAASRAVALLAFNVGVELGQLAVVAVCLPLLLGFRRQPFYRLAFLEGPSFAGIAWVGAVWVVERAIGITLLG